MWMLYANLAVSWALLALIWLVQLVHYPGFRFVDPELFRAFHAHHTASITWIVMPLMLAELGLAAVWAWQTRGATATLAPLLLVLALWASTFLVQVPLHHQLAAGRDSAVIEALIRTNWWRTVLWTCKAVWISGIAVKTGLSGKL
jgi:hypothetical protein